MFPFLSFWDWIYQMIQIILSKFMSWYDFFFTTNAPVLPNEIIEEILFRLPPKSLFQLTCLSKSWHQLICSPHFVKNHLKIAANDKEYTHHRVIFDDLKFCSLPALFNKQQPTPLFPMASPIKNPFLSTTIVGSVNGLICLFDQPTKTYIWNPTINKSKQLLNSTWGTSFYTKYGFGYDELHDDYKAVFIDYCHNSYYDNGSNMSAPRTVISIYILRADSWRKVHDQLQGIFLLNSSGKFANGKLYWASSTDIGNYNVCNIHYFNLADETWGSLELPTVREVGSRIKLGVVGSDLSLLYTSLLGTTASDVWILKDCGVNLSWTKNFSITFPQNAQLYFLMCSPPIDTFTIHFRRSNKDEFFLLLHSFIMICDDSTRQLEQHSADVEGCNRAEIYVESIVDPLMISAQGRRIHETSQSLS